MSEISSYTFTLARFVYEELKSMRHANGSKVVHLNHRDDAFSNPSEQGPIINYNVLKADGSFIGYAEVIIVNFIFVFNVSNEVCKV